MKKNFALAFILPMLALAQPLCAQDIFIRPNSDNKPDIGNLGMRPKEQAKPAPAPTEQAEQPAPTPTQIVTPTPAPAPPPAPVAIVPTPPPQTYDNGNTGTTIRTVKMGDVDVTQINTSKEPIPQGEGNSFLTINFRPGAVGADEKQNIANSLGLTDSEVMSNCFFQYSVLVSHGQGKGDVIPVRGNAPVRYRFTPPLDYVSVSPSIACRKLRAPLTDTIEENGFFTVGATSSNCSISRTSGTVSYEFAYLGNSQARCTEN